MRGLKNNINAYIYRSEQWEWTALLKGKKGNIVFRGKGSSKSNALLDLYENVFSDLNKYINMDG